MKSAFIVLLTITLAFSQSGFLSSTETSFDNLNSPSNLECLNDFFNSLYAAFNMTQTFVNQCFNNSTAGGMFVFYVLNQEYAQAVTAADRIILPVIGAKIIALNQTLYPALQCYQQSEDFQTLMAYFGMNYENQGEFDALMNLYGQAHVNDMAYNWPSFVTLIQNAEYAQAGTAFAPNEEAMYVNASQGNSEYEIFKAIQNGVFFFYNLTSPYQLASCYNSETGSIGAQYYNGWATAVATSSALYAVNSTLEWRDNNEELIQQLGVIDGCFSNTEDQARLNAAVGYNVNSEQFEDAMTGWMTANPVLYWGVMRTMYQQLNQQNNPLGAGLTLAGYYYIVATSISSNAEQIES